MKRRWWWLTWVRQLPVKSCRLLCVKNVEMYANMYSSDWVCCLTSLINLIWCFEVTLERWPFFSRSTLVRPGGVTSPCSGQNVFPGVAFLFRLPHLNSHPVVVSLTSCTVTDKWGSLRVWERRELIRGLRSAPPPPPPLPWYTLVNSHRLGASEGLLKTSAPVHQRFL